MKAWIHDWCGRWVTRLNNLSVALPTMHCYTVFVFVSLGSTSKATRILSTLSKMLDASLYLAYFITVQHLCFSEENVSGCPYKLTVTTLDCWDCSCSVAKVSWVLYNVLIYSLLGIRYRFLSHFFCLFFYPCQTEEEISVPPLTVYVTTTLTLQKECVKLMHMISGNTSPNFLKRLDCLIWWTDLILSQLYIYIYI